MTEWKASEYERISALQHTMAEEVLALLDLKGNERVLDIGSGNGKVSSEIASRVPQGSVIGVDFSANMVAFASSEYAGSHKNLRFQVADARHLGFGPEFDLVVSFNALHWVPEQALALQSIRAGLKPQGRAQLRMVFRGERMSLEDVLQKTCHSERWHGHFTSSRDPYLHLTPEEYSALAEQNGLKVCNLHTADKAWDFKSRAAFAAFGWVTFVEWTQHVPEAEKPEFINDVLDRYSKVAASAPGEENYFRFYQMDILLEPK